MTPRLPVVSGQQVVAALEQGGYVVARQKGSHVRMRHPDASTRKSLTVPLHRELRVGLLTRIIHEAAGDFMNNPPFGLRREALARLSLRVSLEQVRSTVSKPAQAQQALVQALMSENLFFANNVG